MRTRNLIIAVISILFIILWTYTGIQKIIDLPNFRNQMSKSPMLTNLAPVLAYAVPISEIAIAYLLLYNKTRLLGLYFSLFLMTMFITYLYLILNYSFYVPCACGGVISGMDWNTHIIFNTGFALLAVVGILLMAKYKNAVWLQDKESPEKNLEMNYQ